MPHSFLAQVRNLEKLVSNLSETIVQDPRVILLKDQNKVKDIEATASNILNDLYLLELKIERLKLETKDGN